jgi:putative glutamine amidotransferase
MVSRRPLVGVTARRLTADRVRGWQSDGAGVRASYLERVRAAGGIPVLLAPLPGATDDVDEIVASVDALVLSGGPDVDPVHFDQPVHPQTYLDGVDDDFELPLALAALDAGRPLLAICRGIQVLNVALGGTLHQHITELPGVEPHGRPSEPGGEWHHSVTLEPGSRLARVMRTTTPTVSCHHHQSIDRVGKGLRVVGRGADGIVEAVELDDAGDDRFVLAVQWHPEDTAPNDPAQQALFDALVARARARS